MGIDARLLVVDGNCGDWGFSHTVLSLDRDYELWEEIKACEPQLRPGFSLHTFAGKRIDSGYYEGERVYGEIERDPYGDPIRFLTANHLGEAFAAWGRKSEHPERLSKHNIAAGCFLQMLPEQTLVGLYWH